MSSLFDSLVNARLDGTRFSFYTDEEIEKLSVKEIHNPMAYDELNNPTPGGICDEAMGVSALDKLSTCKTCGCDSVHCPGHMGHIKLVSTCYNPFSIKLLHKLLKSKCLMCHRIRIYPKRIELYEIRLQLIKLGYLVEAAKLGEYTDFSLDSIDASIKILRKKLSIKNTSKEGDAEEPTNQQKDETLTALEALSEKEKENREIFYSQISSILKDGTPNSTTSIAMTIAVREIVKEVMSSIVPSKCPHCDARNPRIRKEGATKFFQMPLSKKDLKSMKSTHSRFDMRIDMSTIGAFSEFDDDEDDDESKEEEATQKEGEDVPEKKQKYMNPLEIREHMRRLWDVENTLLEPIFGSFKIFFMNNLLVSPNRFRPESAGGKQAGDDRDYLHAHSAMLTKILNANRDLRKTIEIKEKLIPEEENKHDSASEHTGAPSTDIGRREITSKEVIKCWIDLQDAINCYLDSSLAAKTENREKPGLRQLLERKEGIFRMKMMGKRVNFAGRSVISPDPYISTDQIGVPEFIARTLTFPEPVRNLEKLTKCVINGAHKHPGANFIEYPNGEKKALENMTLEERKAEAALLGSGGKVVYRHLETGDPLLVNRQPTLHKPSIMAHIARVLPKEQTIRMHYCNCKSYNADFDGDEMNIHLPQNYSAIAEAYEIAATHKQYVVPTSGAPIRGLIQDFIVSSVYLTSKDTFLSKEQYNQLIYSALNEFIESRVIKKVHLEIPAFIKTRQGPMWSGKQVVSTILKNLSFDDRDFTDQYKGDALKLGLNLTSKARLEGNNWGPLGQEEGVVIIKNNELLQGVLDKNQLGDSKFGLVHSFYEVYGSKRAGQLLTAFGRLLVAYLQFHGFTCGLDDALVSLGKS